MMPALRILQSEADPCITLEMAIRMREETRKRRRAPGGHVEIKCLLRNDTNRWMNVYGRERSMDGIEIATKIGRTSWNGDG